jgi:DNA-binding transcriptional LysR family regulator
MIFVIIAKVMNLNRITMLVRVAESGSFSAASRMLGVPTSSVSRAIAALEADLGVRLFHRTTRKLALTEAGQHYFATVRGALGVIEDANAAASDASREPRGTVRMTAPADMASLFFMQLIARFTARYPHVHVDIIFANRRVNMIDEGVDLALRAGPLDDSSAMTKRIGATQIALYASRSYVDRRGQPRTLAQLAQHSCIVLRGNAGVVPWRLTGPRGEEELRVHGSVTVDGMVASRAAVNAGLGIGLLPTLYLPGEQPDIELVRILPRYVNRGGPLSLVWTSSRFLPKHVALLRDHLADELTPIMAGSARRG